jgi:hypothetical protein
MKKKKKPHFAKNATQYMSKETRVTKENQPKMEVNQL